MARRVPPGTPLGEVSPRLLYLLDTWRRHTYDWQLSSLTMLASDGGSLVQPHFVSLDSSGKGPTLIFLEDTTLIVERVQQSKLAALGRLSASIAHEIRNPVGAMSHAAQLLAEAPDAVAAGAAPHGHHHQQRRAGQHDHQQRAAAVAPRLDAARSASSSTAGCAEFLAEFRQTSQVDERAIRLLAAPATSKCASIPRTCISCCGICARTRSSTADATDNDAPVELRTGRISTSERPFLEVMDRGPGIAPADAERIFEPFFTGRQGRHGSRPVHRARARAMQSRRADLRAAQRRW